MLVTMFTFSYLKQLPKCMRLMLKRNKSFNSYEWLKRRKADIYVAKAGKLNYRCRSAFKLIEIDDKYKIIKPGFKVLDVGASPGSWSQVLADRTNSNQKDPDKEAGLVIAVDLQPIYPIQGVTLLTTMDFTKESSEKIIIEALGENEKFDFVFSDMAPKATGIKTLDQEQILELVFPVLLFSVKYLKTGGGFLVKLWGCNFPKFISESQRFFNMVQLVKPDATYSSSSEIYVLAREFKGLKK